MEGRTRTDTGRSFSLAQWISWIESKGSGGWIVQLNEWTRAGMLVRHSKHLLSDFCVRMPNFWTWFRHFHLAECIQVCFCGLLLMITQTIKLISSLKVLLPQVFTLFRAVLCAPSYWPLPKSHWPLPKSYWQSTSKTNGVGAEWEEFLVLVES